MTVRFNFDLEKLNRKKEFSKKKLLAIVSASLLFCLTACSNISSFDLDSSKPKVITTTAIIADLVKNVGGDRIEVISLVPKEADPHSYEPTLRDVRNVVYADLALSNYMMLEQHGIIKTLDANLRENVPNISLAEESVKYAAEIIPLVENLNLDTIWLGLRATGEGENYEITRSSDVQLSMVSATGPGEVYGYLTGSFGQPEVYFNSSNGFDETTGYRDDTAILPAAAHTHMSWVFTEPGIYEVGFEARLQLDQTSKSVSLGSANFTFAVGINPSGAQTRGQEILREGHGDITVDIDTGEVYFLYDSQGGGEHSQSIIRPENLIIEVPNKALEAIPSQNYFRFLGRAGDRIFQLPQAVLGKHVHGEIDPHLWQNVKNAMSYTELIRDVLIRLDPAGTVQYSLNASEYLKKLELLDNEVREIISTIPEHNRYLITTHDAFGYLAKAYGLEVAGFVTPSPGSEVSLSQRKKLSETIKNLQVKAVFLEPNLIARSSTLVEVAKEQNIQICKIYGDSFDGEITSYLEMMKANAQSLKQCLGTQSNG